MRNIVGINIRQRRLELGMTQTDLAHKMGYTSKVSISSVERGKEDLSTERVRRFAEALLCTPADLMGWKVETQEQSVRQYLLSYAKLIQAYQKAPVNIQKSICMTLDIPYIQNDRPD